MCRCGEYWFGGGDITSSNGEGDGGAVVCNVD